MNKIVVIMVGAFLLRCLGGYEDDELGPGYRAGGFSYADPEKQAFVLKAMSDQGIAYSVSKDGVIRYLLENEAEVLGIKRKIEYGESLDENQWEAMILATDIAREKYEEAFKENGIPYFVLERAEVVQINWSQINGPVVDVIREKVELELMDVYVKQRHE